MSASLLSLILGAALLHASWNIIIKSGGNKLYETGLTATGGFLVGLCFLPFLPAPDAASWPFLCLSCLIHTVYYLWMASAYEKADLTLSYTVMRGVAPLLTSLVTVFLGTALPGMAWGGVCTLCAGILCLACDAARRASGCRGMGTALLTAVIISAYTLTDGMGARSSGDGASYACWLFVLKMAPIQAVLLWRNGAAYLRYARLRPLPGIMGGAACFFSYGIAIWAMTRAPIAVVAALRETAVIFGMLLAVLFLHEEFSLLRALAVLLVAGGAALLKLA